MTSSQARMRRLGREALRGALAGGLAGVVAGVLDAALVGTRAPLVVAAFAVSCGLFAGFGAIAGAIAGPLVATLARAWAPSFAAMPDRRAWWTSMGAAVVLASFAFVAIGRWALAETAPPLSLVAIAIAALVGGGLVAVHELDVRLRHRPRAQVIAAALQIGLALVLARGLVDAGDTVDLRPLAVLGVFAIAALALAAAPRVPVPRVLAGSVAILVVAAPLVLATRLDARFAAARHAPLSGAAARALGRGLDLDRDGFNPLFGEGDCAPLDGGVHPFGDEIAGNGRDDDCFGGDVDPALLAARAAPALLTAAPSPAPHVVLVTIDTLRADRVGAYGYGRDTTPFIDAVAAEAAVFERVYTSSPATNRALPTLLGGLYPSMFTESLGEAQHELAERRALLPEYLQAAGWRTWMVSSTELVRTNNLDQGLDELDLAPVEHKDASETTTRAIEALRRHAAESPGVPMFLWVHYYDPHGPYEPPRYYRRWDDGGRATGHNRSERYDGEVAYVDDEVGRLFGVLKRTGMWTTSVVVITSDHGEEFLDHGGWYHAEQLYDESVRVPLVVRTPGGAPRRIAEPIGLVDLLPTMLELVGLPAPGAIEGRSQAAAIRGTGPVVAHSILLEQWKHHTDVIEKIGIVRGHDKLVLDRINQLWELYDLAADPRERHNRWDEDPTTAAALREELLEYWQRVRAARSLALPDGAF